MPNAQIEEKSNTAPAAAAAVDGPDSLRDPLANNTGMPDALKAGVEGLSGMDLSDVQVHRNSSQPAALGAQAYAQGNQIHLGAGQEKHLPHEAWHVVQQKQGRVKPTMQMKGGGANADPGLESEADRMGALASAAGQQGMGGALQVASSDGGVKQMVDDPVGRQLSDKDLVFWAKWAVRGEDSVTKNTNSTALLMDVLRNFAIEKEVQVASNQVKAFPLAMPEHLGPEDPEALKVEIARQIKLRMTRDSQQAGAEEVTFEDSTKREECFAFNAPGTWQLNKLKFHGNTEGICGGLQDPMVNNIIAEVRTATKKGRHASGIAINTPYHEHHTQGSGGIGFLYKKEADSTVTPYIIDIATSRHNNDYNWDRSPRSGNPSNPF